jgi:hypothetical protein
MEIENNCIKFKSEPDMYEMEQAAMRGGRA